MLNYQRVQFVQFNGGFHQGDPYTPPVPGWKKNWKGHPGSIPGGVAFTDRPAPPHPMPPLMAEMHHIPNLKSPATSHLMANLDIL